MTTATNIAPAPSRVLHTSFELALLDDERVLVHGQPQRDRLLKYGLVVTVLVSALTGFGLLLLPLLYFVQRAWVNKHNYWLTSSRVIVTNGIIGFRARSIPLERVSDVAISCNWLETWMGLRSVIVRDMTGEAMSGARMLAAPDAAALQRRILDQVALVNGRCTIDAEAPQGDVYRALPADAELVRLLRQIEQNTR